MAYSTPAMVRKALVPDSDGSQPTEVTHTAADLTDGQLADAIAEADATIDSYLNRFYTVPVANDATTGQTPHPVDFWSRNIAAYNATLSYRGSQDFADGDPVARRYLGTMEALKGVSQGTASLNLPFNAGDSGVANAGPPINPYTGTLWAPEDFVTSGPDRVWPGPFWRSGW